MNAQKNSRKLLARARLHRIKTLQVWMVTCKQIGEALAQKNTDKAILITYLSEEKQEEYEIASYEYYKIKSQRY